MFKEKIKGFWDQYKKTKKFWLISIIIIIVLITVFHKNDSAIDVGITTAIIGNVVDSVVLSGRTASASAVKLGFADTGRVSHVYIKEGQKVFKGQLLASLDTSDIYLNDIARVTKEQDVLVNNAYRNLISTGLQVIPEKIMNGIIEATISGVYSGPEGEYRLRIYDSSTNSGKSFEISGLENGETQPITVDTAVPLGSRGLYIQFSSIPSDSGTWIVSIPNKRATTYTTYFNAYESAKATRDRVIDDAKLSNENALSRMNKRKIYAPFSGVIASVDIKTGESTGSISSSDGTTSGTITLISENDYEVTLKTPEISVAKLSVGQDVVLNLDAYGKDVVFPGKITLINPAETIVEGVPIYETKVSFVDKDDRIRSGMTATATIITKQKENVIKIPVNYIYSENNQAYVFVINGEEKEKRLVTTGLRGSDSFVEIIDGLSEGEQVSTDLLK